MPSPADDEAVMRSAISLAMRGRGAVEPNPMVGCVIVKDGCEIGRGWHQRYGQPHAEPNALAICSESPEGATAYVTLEPCCHTSKQTPPCVPRLITAKVARVVVGCVDPNPAVAGRGVRQLREAGIGVDVGVCEASCRQLIAPFFARQCLGRPYVTLKWAQTVDGKVAGPGGRQLQISGPEANDAVHDLRARCDAILVGVNTVLVDDPLLTGRGREPMRPLTRVVLDRRLRTPLSSRLVQTVAAHGLTIICGPDADHARAEALRARGVRVKTSAGLADALSLLNRSGVSHLVVEPGPTLAAAFLSAGLADRVWVFRSRHVAGGTNALAAPVVPGRWVAVGEAEVGPDQWTELLDPESLAFFAPDASADFLAKGVAELRLPPVPSPGTPGED